MKVFRLMLLTVFGLYLLVIAFLYFAQETFIFQPRKLDNGHQFSFAHEFHEINLNMEDGAIINALHFKSDSSKGLILYFHGNAGNLIRWGEVVGYYVELNYDVLVMDYRQYGKSHGEWSYQAFLSDADAFYLYAKELYNEDQIVVYGRSLGTGMASWVASRNNPKALILESPFTSIADMGAFFYPLAPAKWLIRYDFRPAEYLQQAQCPIYIFHGTSDLIVPYLLGKRLFDNLNKHKEVNLVTIDGGGHNDLIEFPKFKEQMNKLLF